MIIEVVQDDLLDIRVGIKCNGKKAGLPEGYKLQFNTSVRTDEGKIKISVSSDDVDTDGKIRIEKDLSEHNISPGNYRFELNLLLGDGKKKTIIPKMRGKIIILPKEGDTDED